MGGMLGSAAGGGGLCWAQVQWDTGCAGISGHSTITLGDCGLSMLADFAPLELAAAPLEVGGHPTCPFRYVRGPSDL